MESARKSWRLLVLAAVGLGIMRVLVQRRRMINLRGKTVVITGGSRGLGLALAREYAAEGAGLVLCARDEQELERARQMLLEMEADVFTILCDVSDQQQVQRAVQEAIEHFGRIDVLVNNAGVITAGPWYTQERRDFEASMSIIFWGTYNMTYAVLPQMKKQGGGRIVNIASIGGKVSVPHLLPYASAKFAVVGFSEGMRAELAKDGIVVTTVAPGLMRTGSPINTIIKGSKNREEYTLFKLMDTLPATSIGVQRAARQIVRATKLGSGELIISLQAQLLARFHGIFPGLTTDILGIANQFLPEGVGIARHSGRESETVVSSSALTALGQRAEREYNESPEPRPQD